MSLLCLLWSQVFPCSPPRVLAFYTGFPGSGFSGISGVFLALSLWGALKIGSGFLQISKFWGHIGSSWLIQATVNGFHTFYVKRDDSQ